ncbi:chloride channel protein [Krasilnikoviella flava]|uniref:H+/Cl-antiporter ClcA n=1 Tax=Krasilnikoviella flava TaxID=526729 RepID=A0A1T5L6W0_9MICO|nr:chloride channel protein [Krasilnikoviella flava]SKC71673.1 H+/Cl-antiporter ClcA [Krasilnikoviella flava]
MAGAAPQEVAQTPTWRPYVALLGTSAVLGVVVSVVAFAFLALLHGLTHAVWEELPQAWGFSDVPWWWPLPWLAVAGVVVGLAVRSLPGHGGHVPVKGLSMGPVPASYVPGVLLAALAGLPLGVVLGPEGPLLMLGSAVALILVRPWGASLGDPARHVLALAGAAAAVSAIFGSPVVGAVFVVEATAVSGVAGQALVRAVLPSVLSSGIGALVFTGVGSWTGLEISSLTLPDLDVPARLDVLDIVWTVPLAVLVAVGMRLVHGLGFAVARQAATRPFWTAVVGALAVGVCASAYALLTGRSPEDVALSGQALLGTLAADPEAWGLGALAALLLLKGLGYGISLGSLRGGPIFPAVLLGAAAGVLVGGLPGFGAVPALAAGMAAATAATLPFPISAAVLVVLLIGPSAPAMAPIVLLAASVGYVVEHYVLAPRRDADHVPAG